MGEIMMGKFIEEINQSIKIWKENKFHQRSNKQQTYFHFFQSDWQNKKLSIIYHYWLGYRGKGTVIHYREFKLEHLLGGQLGIAYKNVKSLVSLIQQFHF